MVTDRAYAICLRMARDHYENFPVASRLLPARVRPHIAAIYAFARIADDLADEGDRASDERLTLLTRWRDRLHEAVDGRLDGGDTDEDAVFVALAATVHACNLELALFDDLISAFTQDVTVKRYAAWDDLLDYCRRSANPVGRLVLRVHGHRGPVLDAQSDAICTALQLTNFWQDLAHDWRIGRLYVPNEVVIHAEAREDDLRRGRWTSEWSSALRECARRTQALFDRGRPLAAALGGRLGWEVRATWLGGTRILHRLESGGFDIFRDRPSLSWTDGASIAARAVLWRA